MEQDEEKEEQEEEKEEEENEEEDKKQKNRERRKRRREERRRGRYSEGKILKRRDPQEERSSEWEILWRWGSSEGISKSSGGKILRRGALGGVDWALSPHNQNTTFFFVYKYTTRLDDDDGGDDNNNGPPAVILVILKWAHIKNLNITTLRFNIYSSFSPSHSSLTPPPPPPTTPHPLTSPPPPTTLAISPIPPSS
ncbi:major centromere autoantigen B-like [Macrobrachium nipponense]|uniref:major centromere autoantigen B-like n=1 Tax=Macrobrachium nipponense TaxID=159736 RepID=UPI0030C8CC37